MTKTQKTKKAKRGAVRLPYDFDGGYSVKRNDPEDDGCRELIEKRFAGDEETIAELLLALAIPRHKARRPDHEAAEAAPPD